MQYFTTGQANIVVADLVSKTGDAIIAGTVNFYLVAVTGANAGKWFRASDSSWQAAEASAGSATYKGGSQWQLSIVTEAWTAGVHYSLYTKESGDLNIPYSDIIIADDADILETIKDISEGDMTIDTTATPWQIVIKKKGTDTELIRKNLKDVNGNNITDVTTVIGQQLEP